jgi:phytoene synthase
MNASIQTQTWEPMLLNKARDSRQAALFTTPEAVEDQALLARAYARCERVTADHSRSFYLASSLLPAGKRRAMRALYAFCRATDDLVDHPGDDPAAALRAWRRRALSPHPPAGDLVATAWADTRLSYLIPQHYAEQLIDGVARDLQPMRLQSFDELAAYAYGVASTVGLMAMHIIGFASPDAIPYAIKLGVALQMTNVLRDVAEDWQRGRVYLPQDELAGFELGDGDLAAGQVDSRWRAFMRFQIERNRQLYLEAWPGIAMLNSDGRLAVAAAAEFYRAILDDIEDHDYDVFSRRAHLGTGDKLAKLPGIWWRSRHNKELVQ